MVALIAKRCRNVGDIGLCWRCLTVAAIVVPKLARSRLHRIENFVNLRHRQHFVEIREFDSRPRLQPRKRLGLQMPE